MVTHLSGPGKVTSRIFTLRKSISLSMHTDAEAKAKVGVSGPLRYIFTSAARMVGPLERSKAFLQRSSVLLSQASISYPASTCINLSSTYCEPNFMPDSFKAAEMDSTSSLLNGRMLFEPFIALASLIISDRLEALDLADVD